MGTTLEVDGLAAGADCWRLFDHSNLKAIATEPACECWTCDTCSRDDYLWSTVGHWLGMKDEVIWCDGDD